MLADVGRAGKRASALSWPKLPGLWPYCGIKWLDRLSKALGDFVEAQQFHWSERRIAKTKKSKK